MNLVKENIDFKRGQESKSAMGVGMDSLSGRRRRAYNLEKYIKYIREDSMETVIENIGHYENAIDNLMDQGLKPKEIGITLQRAKIAIPAWRIIQGNTISNMTFSESDAEELKKAITKFDIDRSPEYTHIEKDSTPQYMEIRELYNFWKRRGWTWKD